jgi:Ca2+-binding EF-hand superfamily protein
MVTQLNDALENWFVEHEIKEAVTYHVVEHMMELLDDDCDGEVSKEEFMSQFSYEDDGNETTRFSEFMFVNDFPDKDGLFNMIDGQSKNDGMISTDELYSVFGPWLEHHHMDILNIVAVTKAAVRPPKKGTMSADEAFCEVFADHLLTYAGVPSNQKFARHDVAAQISDDPDGGRLARWIDYYKFPKIDDLRVAIEGKQKVKRPMMTLHQFRAAVRNWMFAGDVRQFVLNHYVEQMMKMADANNDGEVSKDEFLNYFGQEDVESNELAKFVSSLPDAAGLFDAIDAMGSKDGLISLVEMVAVIEPWIGERESVQHTAQTF